ncbi:MAG: phosphoribosylanthranilate isomerase [Kordiimonadaceae bacterium]|nr:phosphoribosylanthranilate isomerase [Kordiimonadaceae bacterium]
MGIAVKICGISEAEHAHTAANAGADFLGFVFFPPSPRNLSLDAARALAPELPTEPKRVGVFVSADEALITGAITALNLDLIQLHGKETPEDAARLKKLTGLPIIKAIAVSEEADLAKADLFAPHVDYILFDAKPPKGALLPGGNAVSFPWHILAGKTLPFKWLLAGGLTPENAAEAIAASGTAGLDISSGIETAPGKKSSTLIKAFLTAVKAVK